MSLLKEKKGLIMGVANDRSIAWGIAKKLSEHGADLAFTYLGDSLKKRVIPLCRFCNKRCTNIIHTGKSTNFGKIILFQGQ